MNAAKKACGCGHTRGFGQRQYAFVLILISGIANALEKDSSDLILARQMVNISDYIGECRMKNMWFEQNSTDAITLTQTTEPLLAVSGTIIRQEFGEQDSEAKAEASPKYIFINTFEVYGHSTLTISNIGLPIEMWTLQDPNEMEANLIVRYRGNRECGLKQLAVGKRAFFLIRPRVNPWISTVRRIVSKEEKGEWSSKEKKQYLEKKKESAEFKAIASVDVRTAFGEMVGTELIESRGLQTYSDAIRLELFLQKYDVANNRRIIEEMSKPEESGRKSRANADKRLDALPFMAALKVSEDLCERGQKPGLDELVELLSATKLMMRSRAILKATPDVVVRDWGTERMETSVIMLPLAHSFAKSVDIEILNEDDPVAWYSKNNEKLKWNKDRKIFTVQK